MQALVHTCYFLSPFLAVHQYISHFTIVACSKRPHSKTVSPISLSELCAQFCSHCLQLSLCLSQNFCSSIYASYGLSNKVSFWRNNDLPSINEQLWQYWDLHTFIGHGQMWMGFSTNWLSTHFSKTWQYKTFILIKLFRCFKSILIIYKMYFALV